jgi:hypothetical protein
MKYTKSCLAITLACCVTAPEVRFTATSDAFLPGTITEANGKVTLWLDHGDGIASNFLIGSANKTVSLVPFVNSNMIMIASANCTNINGEQAYDPANSTWWNFTDTRVTNVEVSPFSRVPQYFKGNLIADSLCPKNGTDDCISGELSNLTPFFLITQANGTLIEGNNDGLLGLVPSDSKEFKSYL